MATIVIRMYGYRSEREMLDKAKRLIEHNIREILEDLIEEFYGWENIEEHKEVYNIRITTDYTPDKEGEDVEEYDEDYEEGEEDESKDNYEDDRFLIL